MGQVTAIRTGPLPSEREWQQALVDLFERFRWAVQHVYPLRTQHGWRTGTTASGWPDLVMLRGHRLVALEVKGVRTALRPEQRAWLMRFEDVGARALVLRPTDDWELIVRWAAHPEEMPERFGWEPLPEDHPLYPRLPAGKRWR